MKIESKQNQQRRVVVVLYLAMVGAVESFTACVVSPTKVQHLDAWHISKSPQYSCGRTMSLFSSSSSIQEDDPVALLPLWEAELSSRDITDEKRALLLERIESAKTSAEFGVRRAQFSFYDAFSNQDMESMRNAWSCSKNVRCVHPGMPSLHGIDDIMRSWAEIFMQSGAFSIEPSQTSIDVSGQTALCSCIEETPGGGRLECLNVYRREEGSWKMILHMASPIMRMQQ
jgi:ketosteroid isomerase-like protein